MTSENNWFGEVVAARTPRTRAPASHTASSALPRTGIRVFGVAVGANLRPDSPRTPNQLTQDPARILVTGRLMWPRTWHSHSWPLRGVTEAP